MGKDTIQLSLFQPDNEPLQPLPLQLAKRYKFRLQHHVRENDVIVYSIQDWVMGLTGGDGVKSTQMLREFKKQLRSTPTYFKYPVIAPNGKTYQMDFVEDLTLYKFAAYSRAIEKRPQIKEIKDFLAAAGVLADEIRQDPESAERGIANKRRENALASGKSPEWVASREIGILARNQFTEAIHQANPDMHIGEATNRIYKGTLGMTAAELRKALGIGEKQNPRDHMGELALIYTMASESAARTRLANYADGDIVPIPVIQSVVDMIAKATGKQAQETAALIGIDLITGLPSLGAGK